MPLLYRDARSSIVEARYSRSYGQGQPKFRKPSRVKALGDSCITSLACPTPPDSLPNKLPRLALYHGVWQNCGRYSLHGDEGFSPSVFPIAPW